MPAPELTVADLVDLAAQRRLTTFLGAARDAPAVIAVLDSSPLSGRHRPEGELAMLPAVLVGVGQPDHPAAHLVDVLADSLDGAGALAELVARRPLASVALALLLRHGDDRDVTAGLVAESTTYSMLQGAADFRAWRRSRPIRPTPPAAGSPVRIERDGPVTHLVLDRPGRHNAFDADTSERLVAALTDVLDECDDDPDVRVVVRGEGPSFCSGGDLDEFGSFPDPALAHTIRLSRSAGHLVHLLRDRTEVRLHGACIGAGIEVPAFASRVVAAPYSRIALPELAFGLVPGAGGTVSIPRRIGRHRTMRIALTGETLDATTALAWGLVDHVSPD